MVNMSSHTWANLYEVIQDVKLVGQVDVDVEYEGQQLQLPLLIVEGEHTVNQHCLVMCCQAK